ncbi:hypothetical protein CBOM_05187 [Ceraceosorus bombacis]|uniref:Uncharacterized protein n=1 Tax=Ceraceosorus bombacis TaxID=401625 RepID=A0A0P1BIN6_9BASI|nr:hypothetical protein CBOM_05187 [Ceraceosorus bombacis]
MGSERPRQAEVQMCYKLLWANFISTLIHYSHNFFKAELYPPVFPFVSAFAYRLGIIIFWPPLTLGAYYGWLKFKQGRVHEALPYIVGHALLGATTPGHLFGGVHS